MPDQITTDSKRPSFLGIGAQKAGTSWLYAQLRQHPQIWMPPLKEIHFFDRGWHGTQLDIEKQSDRLQDKRWSRRTNNHLQKIAESNEPEDISWWRKYYLSDYNIDWYRSLFDGSGPGQLTGEITPRYAICSPAMIDEIHQTSPHVKLFLMVRNPIDRFWSQCRMKIENGSLDASQEFDILSFFHSDLGYPRGLYSETIRRFTARFEPANMLIIFFEAIALCPHRLLDEVWDFLGISPLALPPADIATPINKGACTTKIPENIRKQLHDNYADEIRLWAQVFGGHASTWQSTDALSSASGTDLPATIQLTKDHVAALSRHDIKGEH